MAYFQKQNETPYYELSNNEITETQNNQTPYQETPIQVNQQSNGYGNATYRTPPFTFIYFYFGILVLGLIISIIGMIYCFFIDMGERAIIYYIILTLLLFIMTFYVYGKLLSVYVVINISSTLGTIEITKKKIIPCFNKRKIVQIRDVTQVIVQKKTCKFEIIIKLSDGNEIHAFR